MANRLLATGLALLSVSTALCGKDATLWSLQPVRNPTIPEAGKDWARTDIDRFIVSKWEEKTIEPAGDAAPEVLTRRLYFNLIGLPPTPEQIAEFETSSFEDVVDGLLASPGFGEKWARHWLDLARYAESNGRDRNVVFAHAWRYRNWVIDSLNDDKPYDRFLREQIAGDVMPGATGDQIVATGFLTLGPKSFQERDREKFLLDMVDEQIDVMSRSVLGLTIACSRCHDHKFDPIPQADYYALAGILLSSETLHGPGPLYFQSHQHNMPVQLIDNEKRELDATVQSWRNEIYEKTVKVMSLRSAGYKIRRDVNGALRERGLSKPDEDPELLTKHKKSEAMYAEAEVLLKQRDVLFTKEPPKPAYAMVMKEGAAPENCHLREGGVHTERGDEVPRGRLTIPGMPSLDEIGGGESGRKQLADWLVSEQNPLTARVIVNRVWHHLFGTGIVRTVDNFGMTGEAPTHPELLDHLATKFVTEDGWSLKKLIRRIVTSRTWQLASTGGSVAAIEKDPGNSLFWRANLRRLDVEAFRDSLLQISGELDLDPPASGSPLAGVFLGKEYGKESSNRVNFDDEISSFSHRAVYLPIVRNEIPELLKQFDFADSNAPTGARDARTIPGQALYLMNDEFVEARARASAERLLAAPYGNDGERLDSAAVLVLGHELSSDLRKRTLGFLREKNVQPPTEGQGPDSVVVERWTDVFQILFCGVDFRYLE